MKRSAVSVLGCAAVVFTASFARAAMIDALSFNLSNPGDANTLVSGAQAGAPYVTTGWNNVDVSGYGANNELVEATVFTALGAAILTGGYWNTAGRFSLNLYAQGGSLGNNGYAVAGGGPALSLSNYGWHGEKYGSFGGADYIGVAYIPFTTWKLFAMDASGTWLERIDSTTWAPLQVRGGYHTGAYNATWLAVQIVAYGDDPVPEPGTMLILGGSILGLVAGRIKFLRTKLRT